MSLGERIRAARKAAGLTQVEAARRANIAVNTLRLYEAGKRQPRIKQLYAIASALDTTPEVLLGLDDVMRQIQEETQVDEDRDRVLTMELNDQRDNALYFAFREAIETSDALMVDAAKSITDAQLERRLVHGFRILDRRGKIEAVLRITELSDNERFLDRWERLRRDGLLKE